MWLALLGWAWGSHVVEPHMWQQCVDEGMLTEEAHQAVRKELVSHVPGAPELEAALAAELRDR